ncbi:MAG: LPS export ABC transporter periplasmic protein LptC, partial [Fimbriimonadales bacterium]|nr:LPS export ABC transporter periplasmic protein LptC [Fimbriimonadales bacterium]
QPMLAQQDEQGNTLWRLQAKWLQGQTSEGRAEGTLIEVQGWLYRDGKPVLKLVARYARADSERREVEAWGKVQAVSSVSRARLQADRILWKAREDKLIATGAVSIQWGDLIVRDEHLTLDTALQRAWGGE